MRGANWLNETSLTATTRGGVLDCGLLLTCAALLRLTPSLYLQVDYSCMLGVGRRELRRCLCICVKSSTWSERRRNCAHHFGQLSCRATIARSVNFIFNFPVLCRLWTMCQCTVILEYKRLISKTFCNNWPQMCIQNLRMFLGVNITINWYQSSYTFIGYAVPKCGRYSWTTSDFAHLPMWSSV